MHRTLAVSVLAATAATAVASAQEPGQLDRSGARLLAERAGQQVCLTLVEPRRDLRLRRCLLSARAGFIRTAYVDGTCTFGGTRLFGIAPRGTAKVNLSPTRTDGRTARQRLLRIPTRVDPAGGVAFVVRRSLAGTSGVTLTAYDARGERLVQRRLRTFPIAGCAAPPQVAVPGRR
jgi:hypothetical protein